jgi:copper(I)-binding protein
MLHQLAARAVIRDYEDGILSDNIVNHKVETDNLIQLSTKATLEILIHKLIN